MSLSWVHYISPKVLQLFILAVFFKSSTCKLKAKGAAFQKFPCSSVGGVCNLFIQFSATLCALLLKYTKYEWCFISIFKLAAYWVRD